jgi:hypothetical protein
MQMQSTIASFHSSDMRFDVAGRESERRLDGHRTALAHGKHARKL